MVERQKTLIIGDLSLKPGFTSVPNAVIHAPGLSAPAKQTYTALLSFAWKDNECFPGQERLAEVLDVSLRTVQRYLDELRSYGLISWRQQGLNQPNIYTINDLRDVKALQIADMTPVSYPDASNPSAGGPKALRDADTTPVSCPDTSNLSCQDTTPVSYEEYSVKEIDDHTSYDHPDRRLTAPAGGGRKGKPDGTGIGQPMGTRVAAAQPNGARRSSDDSAKLNNRELIAELVQNYRSIEGVQGLKGDYAFIGGLYNEYGYQRVYEALDKLELTMAAEDIEKPLLYVRGILLPGPPAAGSGRHHQRKRTSEHDREAEEKRRALLRSLYAN